jgi:hypothetical protein
MDKTRDSPRFSQRKIAVRTEHFSALLFLEPPEENLSLFWGKESRDGWLTFEDGLPAKV